MSNIFFGGIEKKATAEILIKEKVSGMMSWLEYSPALLESCDTLPLVFDCGAYSLLLSARDIEQYAQFIVSIGNRGIWYASPDCIGNQQKSNENRVYLLSLLPSFLHNRILYIYQYGSDLKYLYKGLEEHKRIGIGGLVPLFKKNDRSVAYQKLLTVVKIICQFDCDCEPHYFGMGGLDVIRMFQRYHSSFTVDCTTWLLSAVNGKQINWKGQQCKVKKSKEDILVENIRTMQNWMDKPEEKAENKEYMQLCLL